MAFLHNPARHKLVRTTANVGNSFYQSYHHAADDETEHQINQHGKRERNKTILLLSKMVDRVV